MVTFPYLKCKEAGSSFWGETCEPCRPRTAHLGLAPARPQTRQCIREREKKRGRERGRAQEAENREGGRGGSLSFRTVPFLHFFVAGWFDRRPDWLLPRAPARGGTNDEGLSLVLCFSEPRLSTLTSPICSRLCTRVVYF